MALICMPVPVCEIEFAYMFMYINQKHSIHKNRYLMQLASYAAEIN